MSYASVAANNAPPLEDQPRPDPSLLNTTPPHHSLIIDDGPKVTLVPPEFKEQLQSGPDEKSNSHAPPSNTPYYKPPKSVKSRELLEDEHTEKPTYLELAKHYFIRPGVAGGLIGLVNIGLLASIGSALYLRPHLRRDTGAISSVIAATIALVSAEGYAAERYRQTSRGQAEEQRAKKEGALIFRHLHEQIMRPGVLGGVVGMVNAVILGSLGYISYQNWNAKWDRRTVSAISVGLLTLWGGEGFLAEKYDSRR